MQPSESPLSNALPSLPLNADVSPFSEEANARVSITPPSWARRARAVVNNITRPLFVAQGLNDPRVPWTEAEQIVKAVRANGGDVWYLVFKDEGHGFRKKANSDWFGAASMLFWQQHLLD